MRLLNFKLGLDYENRIFGLDLLRAFAILFVVYSHGCNFLAPYIDIHWYEFWFLDGVSIFFVLSGFLIGTIFIQGIEQAPLNAAFVFNFWKRRWFRTLPNYFLVLTFLVVYFDLLHHYSYKNSISYFFFLQNMVTEHPAFFREAWSLAVEEWFYLLLPLGYIAFFYINKGAKRKSIFYVIISFICVPLLLRLLVYFYLNNCDKHLYDSIFRKLVFLRFDSIMIGVLGAYLNIYKIELWEKIHRQFKAGIVLMLGIHLIGVLGNFDNRGLCFFMSIFYSFLFSIGVLLIIPKLQNYQPKKIRPWHRFFMFISVISYSMYLLNLTLFKSILGPLYNSLFTGVIENQFLLAILKYTYFWILVIFLSYLLFIFWERPWMELRKKIAPKLKTPN